MAHDIKNILTGIRGGTYMMDQALEGGDQAMLKLGWHVVKVSQDRINQLVFNMLDFSKDRTPAYETVNLAETLGNVRDLIALRAQDAEVEVCLEVHPDAETIEAEGLSIHRCVLNLAGNALDALPDDRPGKVTIRARSDESPDLLALDVQDNGVGIPPEDCAKLFQAFHSSKGAKGTGLGLAVSRKIAVEHGGEITIESTVGVGTTFTIHLPRCKPA